MSSDHLMHNLLRICYTSGGIYYPQEFACSPLICGRPASSPPHALRSGDSLNNRQVIRLNRKRKSRPTTQESSDDRQTFHENRPIYASGSPPGDRQAIVRRLMDFVRCPPSRVAFASPRIHRSGLPFHSATQPAINPTNLPFSATESLNRQPRLFSIHAQPPPEERSPIQRIRKVSVQTPPEIVNLGPSGTPTHAPGIRHQHQRGDVDRRD